MSETILSLHHLRKSYQNARGDVLPILRGVDLSIRAGVVATIIGPSGAGKSTLLHLAGGLDRADEGEVKVDGVSLGTMSDTELATFRNRQIGFVFQFHHLLPEFTAQENVAIPAMISGENISGALSAATELLERVGLADRASHRPAELSGGEQQRVAVARALINKPRLILADEPSGNLDETNASALHDLLWSLSRAEGQTFVIVTHNSDLAQRADVVFRLHDGLVVEEERRSSRP